MAMFGKRIMTMLVGGLGLLFVVACGAVSTDVAPVSTSFLRVEQAIVGVNTPGDVILTGAYCVNVDIMFMQRFTAMLAQYGTAGYWEFIEQKDSPCFDTRMSRQEIKSVRAILLEKMWEFNLYKGNRYTRWEVKDAQGGMAYTWTKIEGQET